MGTCSWLSTQRILDICWMRVGTMNSIFKYQRAPVMHSNNNFFSLCVHGRGIRTHRLMYTLNVFPGSIARKEDIEHL